jgi:DNA-binding transcriptional MerR regulator
MDTKQSSLPKKMYYSISEVCGHTGLEPHVLRYWESEFPQLRPKKNRAGNRAYRTKDIEIIEFIKHLLYEDKFTIPGAKKKLSESKSLDNEQLKLEFAIDEAAAAPDQSSLLPQPQDTPSSSPVSYSTIKEELTEILKLLQK